MPMEASRLSAEGGVDADQRHMDAAQLRHFGLIRGKRRHEHRVHVAPHRQRLEELMAVSGLVDMVPDRDVIAFGMQHTVDAGEHVHVEPAGDAFVHKQGYTVGLPGFDRTCGAGDCVVHARGDLEHAPTCLL